MNSHQLLTVAFCTVVVVVDCLYFPAGFFFGSRLLDIICLVVTLTFCAFLYRAYLYPKFFTPFKQLNTPQDRSIWIGNLRDVHQNYNEIVTSWAHAFPKQELIRVYLLLNQEVLLAFGPNAVHDVLVEKPYEFTPGPVLKLIFKYAGIGGLFTADNQKHKIHRRKLARAFSPSNIERFQHVFWKIAAEMVTTIEKETSHSSSNGAGVIATEELVSRAIIDAFASTQMDEDLKCLQAKSPITDAYRDVWAQNKACKILIACLINSPSTPVPPNNEVRKAAKARKRIYDLVQQSLEKKKLKIHEGWHAEYENITSIMLGNDQFTEQETISHTLTYAAASYETTTLAIQWAIVALSKFPSVQGRLHQEIRAHLPPLDAVDDFSPHIEAVKRMPYLNAFCNEVLRYYTPISMTIREASQDTSILGTPVPRGTLVLVSHDTTNHDLGAWGPDANEFNPDRWIDSKSGFDQHKSRGGVHKNGRTLASFSFGARRCPGQEYAMSEFRCFMASLVGRFAIELEDPSAEVRVTGTFNLTPADGVRARFKKLGDW
ncbi:cytochrome P450 [Aspergillus bertholletiae]|uniref:Cytochrome P450 n=1 Tax=Aspergillus bertholletiae TaxID=1226010 RepID=A0A5N7BIM4_9EURO|nr:cytochrome P450 [Aspergillus bertholletiae]